MTIKALTWEREESDWWVAQPSGMGFGYEVRITDAGRVRVRRGTADWAYFEGTDIEAKAAFQADFDSLIMSFVDPSYASSQAEIERLKTVLAAAFFKIVGLEMASAVEANGWQWPEDAPRHVDITVEAIRAALSGSKE